VALYSDSSSEPASSDAAAACEFKETCEFILCSKHMNS
jgi:hypothetical protein